jgi:hypothetical protein
MLVCWEGKYNSVSACPNTNLSSIQETKEFRAAIGNPTGSFTIPIIAAVYNLAAGVMALSVGWFGMKLGRKNTIQLLVKDLRRCWKVC